MVTVFGRMRKGITRTVLFLVVAGCVPTGVSTTTFVSKKIYFEDMNYEDYVGNVIVNSTNPFVQLGSNDPIKLEFDLLTKTFENLQARLVYCNFDWVPNKVPDMEYLSAFNRFDHVSFDYSINTKRNYIQYFFELARPKLSGNYLVVLHRRNNPDDILFTRRIVCFKNEISVNAQVRIPTIVKERSTHQQLEFEMNYQGLEAPNPQQNFKILLMQNKNWDSAIKDLRATQMQPGSSKMEWRYFSGESTFPGWNQFRFLDLRTLNLRGINISSIENKETGATVVHGMDQSFSDGSYRQLINDSNGRMLPGNSDPGESWLEADYAMVQFTLKSEKLNGNIYLTGRYNNWRKDASNLMKYDEENQLYYVFIRFKQGFYDYRYEVVSMDLPAYDLEGSHYQTENEYDILVYYRAPGRINDQVFAIKSFNSVDFF